MSLEVSCKKGKGDDVISDEKADKGSKCERVEVGESALSGKDFRVSSSCVNQAWGDIHQIAVNRLDKLVHIQCFGRGCIAQRCCEPTD